MIFVDKHPANLTSMAMFNNPFSIVSLFLVVKALH